MWFPIFAWLGLVCTIWEIPSASSLNEVDSYPIRHAPLQRAPAHPDRQTSSLEDNVIKRRHTRALEEEEEGDTSSPRAKRNIAFMARKGMLTQLRSHRVPQMSVHPENEWEDSPYYNDPSNKRERSVEEDGFPQINDEEEDDEDCIDDDDVDESDEGESNLIDALGSAGVVEKRNIAALAGSGRLPSFHWRNRRWADDKRNRPPYIIWRKPRRDSSGEYRRKKCSRRAQGGNIIEQKRNIALMARKGMIPGRGSDENDEGDENNHRSLEKRGRPPLIVILRRPRGRNFASDEEELFDEQKRNIQSLARKGLLSGLHRTQKRFVPPPWNLGGPGTSDENQRQKRNIQMLARKGKVPGKEENASSDAATPKVKRNIQALARKGMLKNGAADEDIEEDKRNVQMLARKISDGKRNVAYLARNGKIPGKRYSDFLNDDSWYGLENIEMQKKNIAALARKGYLPSVENVEDGFEEEKRNVQMLARKGGINGKKEDKEEDKRNIGLMAGKGMIPKRGTEDDIDKRNVAMLARAGKIPGRYEKKNIGMMARNRMIPNKNQEQQNEDKRNAALLARQGFIPERKQKNVAFMASRGMIPRSSFDDDDEIDEDKRNIGLMARKGMIGGSGQYEEVKRNAAMMARKGMIPHHRNKDDEDNDDDNDKKEKKNAAKMAALGMYKG